MMILTLIKPLDLILSTAWCIPFHTLLSVGGSELLALSKFLGLSTSLHL
jgi:hypothetical protein